MTFLATGTFERELVLENPRSSDVAASARE